MKNFIAFLIFLLIIVTTTNAQVTNVLVNGQSSNFTMASGDLVSWSFDVPVPGDTTQIQFWVDTDQNGILNPAVDVIWIYFNHTDGDIQGQNGPPDMDSLANGHVSVQVKLGIAPAHYIMLLKNHNHHYTIHGNVTNLVSPTITVSGTVTVPTGYPKQNITLSLENKGNSDVPFWNALTDVNGNFTIQMKATNPAEWRLRPNTGILFGAAILSPDGIIVNINPGTPAYNGNNFNVEAAAAEIKGALKNEFGSPYIGMDVKVSWGGMGNLERHVQTDTVGEFHLGFLPSELPAADVTLSAGEDNDTSIVHAYYFFPFVNSGNVLTHNLTIFKINSFISGRITLNGSSPNMPLEVHAINTDTGRVNSETDGNGYFNIRVSDKIYNYDISTFNVPMGYFYASVTAHPGQTNVILNLTTTGIKPTDSNIPSAFDLSQNYPNPFNPSTTINYSIAKEGHVKLAIYNSIGSKVSVLVDEYLPAGNYSALFNGKNLASGIYLYKIEAGNYSAAKKFILMK